MNLANPFPTEVRNLFLYVYGCFKCGRSGLGLELHHIWGRVSSSALNACPLCPACHTAILHTPEEHRALLAIVIGFLSESGYRLNANDEAFLAYVQNDLSGFSEML